MPRRQRWSATPAQIFLADGAAVAVRVVQTGTHLACHLVVQTPRAEPLVLVVPGYALGDLVRAVSYAAAVLGQRP